jgi:hypothetical protein
MAALCERYMSHAGGGHLSRIASILRQERFETPSWMEFCGGLDLALGRDVSCCDRGEIAAEPFGLMVYREVDDVFGPVERSIRVWRK